MRERGMSKRKPSGESFGEAFVKAIVLDDNCIHIDLMDGLRLSGPLTRPVEQRRRKRRMVVTGHDAVYAPRTPAVA